MGNAQPRPTQIGQIVEYSIHFTVKTNTESFQYIRDLDTWFECINGVMRFAKSLETPSTHIPVYSLRYVIETRDADVYSMKVSWSSEACKEENMTTALKWYIEKELRRCMKIRYGVKPVITLKKIHMGVSRLTGRMALGAAIGTPNV